MPCEPSLPQPPRRTKVPLAARVRRLPRLPPILGEAAVRQVPHLPRADTAAPRAATEGELQEGYPESGPCGEAV